MKKDMSEFTIATADRLGIQEDIVHELVMWQFEELKRQSNKQSSIELSGIGRLYIRPGILRAKLRKLEAIHEAYMEQVKKDGMTEKMERKLNGIKAEIELLQIKTKSNEFQEYLGRLAQSPNSPERLKRENQGDTNGETRDM